MVLPAKDDFSTYGGQKSDYTSIVDPTTDRSAVEMNAALASLSMMTRTAPRAILKMSVSSGANTHEILLHEAVWGNSNAIIPTITKNSTGIYTVTYPTTVTDALGQTQSVVFNAAVFSENFSGIHPMKANVELINNTNEFYVKTYLLSSLALHDPADVLIITITLW